MNTIKIRIKEFFALWKNYSFSYACYSILWWFCFYIRPPFCGKISTFAINKKTKWLDRYFKNNYHDIINKYLEKNWQTEEIESTHIWVFWGQGEENMPPLVKACYRQLTYYNDNVILLTNDNIKKYVDIPSIVTEKVESGQISWAYFSDIVRNSILTRHGGMWVDATTWVPKKIPCDKLMNYRFVSPAENTYQNDSSIRFWSNLKWNWNGWCMWSNCRNYILYSFVADMLIEIAKKENRIPDYVTIDYLIYLGVRLLPEVEIDFEKAKEITSKNRHELAKRMNKAFDKDEYDELIRDNFIFKLSFRTKWEKKTEKGEQTFYGRILEDII